MSIFSEVGKIIMETAEQDDTAVLEEELTLAEAPPPIPVSMPEIDGEIVMDGEDMLRVVHVNSPAPPILPDTTVPKTTAVPETVFIEDDLSFWENPPEPAVPEPVVIPEAPAEPKTNSRKRTAVAAKTDTTMLPEAEPAAEPKPQPLSAEETPRSTTAAITGDVIFPADATVCADITGNVTAKGVLTMEGSITGNVEAQEVILRGTIHGSVKCGKLTLLPVRPGGAMSSIKGSITAESLSTELS